MNSQSIYEFGLSRRLGPFAELMKAEFVPESVRASVDLETAGARMSEAALKNVKRRHLLKLVESVADRSRFGGLEFGVSMDEAQEYCEHLAEKIEGVLVDYRLYGWPEWYEKQCRVVRANPSTFWGFYHRSECAYRVTAIASEHGVGFDPLELSDSEILPLLLRLTDPAYWFRQYRKRYARLLDEIARAVGRVRKHHSPYVSNHALELWQQQKRRNQRYLEQFDCENEAGETLPLSDVIAGSLSNPEVRRAELMTRLRGFEVLADVLGYKAEFWTITCPSRFHPTITKKGKHHEYSVENLRWVAAGRPTVRDGQHYLRNVWARIRSALARRGIDWFGFRIAEPHADGCPHWHLVVYVPMDCVSTFCDPAKPRSSRVRLGEVAAIARDKALKDSPTEPGAQKHRFVVKPVPEGFDENGRPYSATAYVAKYISKNIDGHGLGGLDDYDGGGSLMDNAQRVVAWASTHGLRQFQQFGGAPVGIWRELRRLYTQRQIDENSQPSEFLDRLFEQTEQEDAAEAWAAFCLVYESDPDRFRFEYELKVVQRPVMNYDLRTGDLRPFMASRVVVGRYGEVQQKLMGLSISNVSFHTRPHNWQLVRRTVAPPEAEQYSQIGEAEMALDLCQ